MLIFHEILRNISPEQHVRLENPSIFGTKIDPKSTTASTFTPGCSFSSSGMTFGLPWSAFRFSWITFGPLWATFLEPSSAPRASREDHKGTPRAPQECPEGAQEHPRSTQKGPQMPKCDFRTKKEPKRSPKLSKRYQKGVPKGPQSIKN